MAKSSLLGGERAPSVPSGTDMDSLGPSDTSDSGSDVQTDASGVALDQGEEGAWPLSHAGTGDAGGTGERASADSTPQADDGDILPDRIGILPADAMDAAVSIDDPTLASVDQLAQDSEDEDEDADENEDDQPDR